jgi:hypothetical protein
MNDLIAILRIEAASAAAIAEVQKIKPAMGEVAQAAGAANQTIAQGAAQAEAAVEAQASSFGDLYRAAAQAYQSITVDAHQAKSALDGMRASAGTALTTVSTGWEGVATAWQQHDYVREWDQATRSLGGVAGGAKITAAETLNLSRQFADVAVTGAMGMSPLMILIQQGPQIGETLAAISTRAGGMAGALRLVAASAWAAVAPMAPFVLAAGAVAAVVGGPLLLATHELNKANGDLTEGMGLTDKQLEKVKDRGITVGDVLAGSFDYASKAVSERFAPQIKWVEDRLSDLYQFVLTGAKAAVNGLVGGFGAGVAILGQLFGNFGAVASDALISAANLGLSAVEGLVNGAVGMLNGLINKANAAAAAVGLPLRAPTLDQVSWPRLVNQHAGAMASVGKAGVKGYAESVAGLKGVWSDMAGDIKASAEARIQEQAGTEAATKALKDHTQAVKDYTTVAKPALADLTKTVDLLDFKRVKAVKSPGSVDGLKSVAGDAGKVWEAYQAEGQKVIDGLADNFERAFVQSGELSFSSIADFAEQQFRQAIYNTLLKEPIQVVLKAVVGNMDGLKSLLGSALGGTLASVLGGAGVGTAIGQSLGLGTGKGGVDLALGLGGAAAGTVFAGSATAMALNGTVAAGIFNAGLGASVATSTAIGGLLTSAAVLGPIAAIAALAVGTLFKSKPSNNGALATLDDNSLVSITGSKRTDQTTQWATNAANAVVQGEQMLRNAGIKLNATVRELDLGTRDATDIVLSDGRRLTSAVGDAAAAAETALKAVLEGATFADQAQESLVKSMMAAGKGFDDIAAALGQLSETQALPKTIADAILKLSDPKTFELNQLGSEQAKRRSSYIDAATEAGFTAEALASLTTQLAQLEGLELDQVLGKYGEALGTATERLKKSESLQNNITDGILKIVSPAAYQFESGRREIASQIEAMRGQAEALIASGDLTEGVLAQLDLLQSLQMDELAKQVAETADTFAQARKGITSWLDALNASASAELSPTAQRERALADYQRILALAQGGDATAAGQFTTYADRLLAADRNATDSAQARLSLFSQVQADAQGLTGISGSAGGLAGQLASLAQPLSALLDVSKLTKVANDNVVAALTPSLKVTQADIPALGTMYSQVQGAQTDRVVAAVEKLRTDLNTAMEAIRATGAASSSAVQTALDNLAAAVGAGLADNAAAIAASADQLADIRRDGAISAAKATLARAS